MSNEINVLSVGAGFMGSLHAKAYDKIDGVRNAGIVTRNYSSSEQLANELGANVPRFTDFEEALEKTSPDAVAISTYTDSHFHYVSTALNRGLHVFVGKATGGDDRGISGVVRPGQPRQSQALCWLHPHDAPFVEQIHRDRS